MKIASILLVLLALVVAFVPQFTDCESQGRAITLANGMTIPMKCHWTGQSELALSAPLLGLGILLRTSRRKESLRSLGVLGMIVGVFIILLPTALIGVCSDPHMICNAVMRPTLILTGTMTCIASLYVTVTAFRAQEDVAWQQA